MKYIHDGNIYVIFTAYEWYSHSDVAQLLSPFTTKHAGFLDFSYDEIPKEPCSYGNSLSLRCEASSFPYDETNYVGISKADFIIISNSKDALSKLGCRDIEVAVWKQSEEGMSGEAPVFYPAHSSMNMRSSALLRR